jgi:hypothetical protein
VARGLDFARELAETLLQIQYLPVVVGGLSCGHDHGGYER